MANLKTTRFDSASYLDDDESYAYYLAEAEESGEFDFIADSIGQVARALGMFEIAKRSGISREKLFKVLNDDENPDMKTLLRVIKAFKLAGIAEVPREKETT